MTPSIIRRLKADNAGQAEYITTLQSEIESRNLRLHVLNRVLRTRDRENRWLTRELSYQRDEHLEALIELQEVKQDLSGHKTYVVQLKHELLNEEASQHDFLEKLWEAQRELASKGHRVKKLINEIDMRIEELKSIAAKEGENSTRYKKKTKLLDQILRLRHEESVQQNTPSPTERDAS